MKRHYTIFMAVVCLLFAIQAEAHKRKKPSLSCDKHGFSSEVIKEEQVSETCVQYEIKVSYDGTKNYGLSHYSIAIPCGEIKDASNSEGWDMEFGKDPKTGVYGLKVDNINRFGEGRSSSFIVKFTWCSSGTCEKDLGVVAYKFGQCVAYDTLSNDNEPEPPQNCSTLLASLQKTNVTCPTSNDGQLQVVIQEGQEPFIFTWSNGATTATAQNLVAGNYAVTIKDAKGNTLTLNETISGPPPISIAQTVINPACSGVSNGAIDLDVTGGVGTLSYAWSNGSTLEDQNNLLSGLYSVTVTDSLGCSAEKTFMLTNSSLISVLSTLKQPSCSQPDGGIDLTITGGLAPYTYLWNTGATTEDLQNVGAGNYTVLVTDALGCSTQKMYSLTIKSSLIVTYVVTPTSCLGDESGAIDLSVFGVAPITIKWQDGPTTEDRTGLAVGSYKVAITDGSGCSQQLNISVGKRPLQVSSIVNQPTCSGDLGTITITPTGGVPPYTYTWSNGETGNTIDGLEKGIYSVTITDATGCSRALFFAIMTPTPIEVTSAVNNAECGKEGSFAINLDVIGGQFPYTYLWSNGATTQDISGLNSGSYSVDIRDAGGCVVTKSFVIDPATANWACLINPVTTPVVCKSAGNILSTAVSGATNYQWTVSSADNSWTITSGAADSAAFYTAGNPATTATFTLTITKNGCTQTCSYTISNGCIQRDNTGGGDPSSGEPCTTPPTTPPVVEQPQPEEPAEEEQHGCKVKIVNAYPNPFRDYVKFEWKASKNDHVKLEIYDSRGKRISVVYDGPVNAGKQYSFNWNTEGSGKDRYYYYRLTSSKSVDHGKLVRK
jgi:hypothetical protein